MALRIDSNAQQKIQPSQQTAAKAKRLRAVAKRTLPKVLDRYEPATQKTALALTSSSLGAPQIDLQQGMSGPDVLALQNALVALGYMTQAQVQTGPGIFGPRTLAAVQSFQSDWGVPSTGYYGPLTREALTNALSGEPKPPAPPPGSYDGTHPAPGTTNTQAWVPATPPVTGDPAHRSAATYDQVINQFAVGVNPRYAPRNGNTYCNIFAWDVTRAMGAEIPHWVGANGQPVGVGEGNELNANATNQWLHAHGAEYGWRQVSAAEAQALANQGHPAVASWRNPGGIGHIGVVRPGSDNGHGPALAQAGAQNFNQGHVYDVFPTTGTEFWVNDAGAVGTQPTPPTSPAPTPPAVTAGAPEIDLARGANGPEVEALQHALVKLGFMTQADMDTGPGIFGPRTEASLKAFQAAHGVPNTGYYGPLSRAALTSALGGAKPAPAPAAPTYSVPGVDLEIGANGAQVEQLQRTLVHLGFMTQAAMDTGPGIFGPRTQAAVKAFQAAWSVPTTGYFGPLTRAAMTKALGGVTPPAPTGIPGAEQAIAFAKSPGANPQDPSGSYHYWCLALVSDAYKAAGRALPGLAKPKAYDAYLAYANAGKVQTSGTPPRGALVFFNSYMPYGHIGISLGDGTYIGTFESGPQTGVRNVFTSTYLGWALP